MYKNLLFTFSLLCILSACKKDACETVICNNGGSCKDGTCTCPVGYEGVFCETSIALLFTGNYAATYDCTSATQEVALSLKPAAPANIITLRNLGDYCLPTDALIDATVRNDSLFIQNQTTCVSTGFAGYTYQGIGIRKGDSLSLTFSVSYNAGGTPHTDNCKALLIKK